MPDQPQSENTASATPSDNTDHDHEALAEDVTAVNEASEPPDSSSALPDSEPSASEYEDDAQAESPVPTIKLNKYLAECGVASRRRSEELIAEGRVMVDGKIEKNIARRIDPLSAQVKMDGKFIRPQTASLAYALYKPRNCVCTLDDPQGRPTIAEYFPKIKARLFTVGRLDFDTEGLIIITNDGELANSISHPSRHVWKTYFVKVKGLIDQRTLESFDRRPVIDNVKRQKVNLKLIHNINDKTWIEVRLQEGVNRQIKKMFAAEGYRVLKIKRISIGPVSLGELEPGECRELTRKELDSFKGV